MSDRKEKEMSTEEILAADVASLTPQQMQTRIQILQVLKAQQELEVAEHQNREFQDKKEERIRQARNKTAIIEAEAELIRNTQNSCLHKSGGKGRAGFFQGDGKFGYTVSLQQLPTSETYGICLRCQREWHRPSKRAVLDGVLSLAAYRQQEREFAEMLSWDKPLTTTDSGEIAGSVLFRIPALEAARAKDDAEFNEFLQRQGARP
jgi:hypothetical protein